MGQMTNGPSLRFVSMRSFQFHGGNEHRPTKNKRAPRKLNFPGQRETDFNATMVLVDLTFPIFRSLRPTVGALAGKVDFCCEPLQILKLPPKLFDVIKAT